MLYQTLHQYDVTVFYWFNHLPHPHILNVLASLIHYGTKGSLIYIPFFIILLVAHHYRATLIIAGSLLLAGSTTNLVLKHLFHRARPFNALMHVIALPPLPSSFSFPSGETTGAFAVAMACVLVFPGKAWKLVWIWAGIVILDRVYMGHHYPTDVLAGALVGIIASYIVVGVATYYSKTT